MYCLAFVRLVTLSLSITVKLRKIKKLSPKILNFKLQLFKIFCFLLQKEHIYLIFVVNKNSKILKLVFIYKSQLFLRFDKKIYYIIIKLITKIKKRGKIMINRTMSIGEIIQIFPDSVEIMMSHGLHCVGCHVASWESLEEGCRGHGMSDDKIEHLVNEINEKCGK